MADISDSKLIGLVENYVFLYDKSSKHFKDAKMRQNAWDVVAKEMNSTVENCQRIWKNIRDRYAKEKRHLRNTPAGFVAPEPTWHLFKSLTFLNPHIRGRRTISNMSCKKENIDENNEHQMSEDLDDIPVSLRSSTPESEVYTEFVEVNEYIPNSSTKMELSFENVRSESGLSDQKSQKLPTAARKRVREEIPAAASIDNAIDSLSCYLKEQTKTNSDSAFGQYVGSTLHEMSKRKKNKAKAEIVNILIRIETEDSN